MATFFDGGADLFRGMVYGDYHPNTIKMLTDQNAQSATMTERLTDAGKSFMSQVDSFVQKVDFNNTMRVMQAAARMVTSLWKANIFRELKTIGDMQHAPPVMREFIMAAPEIRTMYHRQQIEGFNGWYVDVEPGRVGEDHYHYRRVMDGIVQEDGDKWFATSYQEEVLSGHELDVATQAVVLNTWDNFKAKILEGGDDPTSRWNAAL